MSNVIAMESKSDVLAKARKEVIYLGITDTILGCIYLTCVAVMGGISNFYPHIVFWIFIIIFHVVHITAAATLLAGNVKNGNKATKLAVCKFWLYYSRFILRMFFPLEFLLILIVVYGDSENDLVFAWILFIIVEEIFLYLAIASVNSYDTLLQLSDNGDNIADEIDPSILSPSTSSPNASVIESRTTSTDNIVQQS